MKLKVTFLAKRDYANVLTEYSNIINEYSEHYESKIICMSRHPLNYTLQHDYDLDTTKKNKEIEKWLVETKHIIFSEEIGYGQYKVLDFFIKKFSINIEDKLISVWHPGTNYRKSINLFNNNPFNSKLHKRIYAIDLYKDSPKENKDVVLLPFKAFDGDYDTYMTNVMSKLKNKVISHFPSDYKTKGTNKINKIINNNDIKLKYVYSKERIPNNEVINEKSKSIFYIDQFNDYRSFGVASIEALISGNIVLCSISNAIEGLNRYRGGMNIPIIDLGMTDETLEKVLIETLNKDDDYILNLFEKNFKFLKDCFYGPNVVKYLENKILR